MNLSDLLGPWSSVAEILEKGPPPTIEKDEVNGLIVSTVNTYDFGYETAIIDAVKTYPVERYATEELSKEGHDRWVKKCAGGITEITMLGDWGLAPEAIKLRRGEK